MPPKELYEDEEFGAKWTSLNDPHVAVTWKRPHEISENPMLFVDGSSRFDINQGSLGDCWFMAASAAVAEHPDLLRMVVPKGQVLYGPGYDGSVRFRFWNLGSWEEVKIDDRLPVDEYNRPVYAYCKDENEFWMPLLEKAFARLYGNYGLIEGGYCCEGLMKLTGLSVESLEFRNWTYDTDFQKIKNGLDNNGVIVVGVSWGGPGIPGSHAYTVTKAFHLRKEENNGEELRLVRVRNPWGNEVEWTGAWSDGDERWNKLSQEIRVALQYSPGEDGEFWMDIKDFVKNFSDGAILTNKPEGCVNMKVVQQIKGAWDADTFGGPPIIIEQFAKSPQFLLKANGQENIIPGDFYNGRCGDKSAVVEAYIEIIMEDNRKNSPELCPGFFVFQVPDAEKRLSAEELLEAHAVTGVFFKDAAVGVRERVVLEPGRCYVVVVAQTYRQQEKFLFRIYSHYPIITLKELQA